MAITEAPAEIKAVFGQYSEKGIMTADHLQRFLIEVQKQVDSTKDEAQAIIEKCLHEFKHFSILHRKVLNLEAFFRYLFSDLNPPLFSLGVHQDMTAPLSHYYIHTGHNSYLTGNQLSSDCSDVPIIEALKKGVRVIELDLWPNSTEDNIDVLHGRTLTAPVEFIKCLKSIKDHAFTASEYPVVITLEDHLIPDLQAKVAQMVTETFGDMLFCPGSECLAEFPSPELLKRRIIISTKPPKEYLKSKEEKDRGKSPREESAWGKEVSSLRSNSGTDEKENSLDEEDSNDEEEVAGENVKLHEHTSPEYKRLIAIHAGKPKGVPADSVMKKTKALEDNWVPAWNEEFEFPLTAPEIAILRIEVHEHDMSEKDDFAGQTCLPISELRQGIHAVPLCSQKGVKYKSVKLLLRLEFV